MLIRKIELENFRQFIGHQEIEFSTDKQHNVTVLIGKNTSGKTTLIRAFEWILYNKKEFDDKILLNKSIAENMNAAETCDVKGVLYIEHNGSEYVISRKETYTGTNSGYVRASASIARIEKLQADGQTKTLIDTSFDQNIERILPRNLSNYFFFGGERVGAISGREDIESSVKGLMGLDVLDNAMTHLKSVISKFKKSMDFSSDKNASLINSKLNNALIRKSEVEADIVTYKEQIDYYCEEKEKFAALLKANESTARAQKKREQLNMVIADLQSKIERAKKEMVSAFSKNSFAFFSMPLLKEAIKRLEKASDDTESVPEMTSASIDYILKRGVCICGTCISKGSLAEKCLLDEQAKQPPEAIGSLVRRYREQAMDYLSSADDYVSGVKNRFEDIRRMQRELQLRIDEREEISALLLNAKDNSELEKQYRQSDERYREFVRKKDQAVGLVRQYEMEIASCESQLKSYTATNERNQRISRYIDYAQATYAWIAHSFLERERTVRQKLEERVNSNFAKMYHGSRSITIDDKYRVKYIDVTTEESEGLKAVKSFAFVSALVDLAKEILSNEGDAEVGPQYYPLVMDAPFSNMDETHIRNVSELLPKSAEQVIIAVMQKDWEPAAKIMAPIVGKSYLIEKDNNVNGTPCDIRSHVIPSELISHSEEN